MQHNRYILTIYEKTTNKKDHKRYTNSPRAMLIVTCSLQLIAAQHTIGIQLVRVCTRCDRQTRFRSIVGTEPENTCTITLLFKWLTHILHWMYQETDILVPVRIGDKVSLRTLLVTLYDRYTLRPDQRTTKHVLYFEVSFHWRGLTLQVPLSYYLNQTKCLLSAELKQMFSIRHQQCCKVIEMSLTGICSKSTCIQRQLSCKIFCCTWMRHLTILLK